MDLIAELKQIEQVVSDFTEKLSSIEKECCLHLESLEVAKKKDRRKVEADFKSFVDSLRTQRRSNQMLNVHNTQPEIRKNHSHLDVPADSDDDFLSGPVRQKPKKLLCLSIKKSDKRSKCTSEKRLLDGIPDEEQAGYSTPKMQGADRENARNREDQARISISWTAKIKESSVRHTNQVRITGSERKHLDTTYLQKPISNFQKSSSQEPEVEQRRAGVKKIRPSGPPNDTGTCSGLSGNEVKNECKDFPECRVVVRKLSTSHKIFQPKVVLRKLTDDEMSKICGREREIPNSGPTNSSKVRYTSLILQPARNSPRVFSTVKMRSLVMKLVLTPAQIDLKSEAAKTVEPISSNEMVKSMFKTKSKCVQEWRSRVRTKDVGRCELISRKSFKILNDQQKHTDSAQIDKLVTAKCGQETKRSKCNPGLRAKSTHKNIQDQQSTNDQRSKNRLDRLHKFVKIQGNQHACHESEQEPRNSDERKPSEVLPHFLHSESTCSTRKLEKFDEVFGNLDVEDIKLLTTCANSTSWHKHSKDEGEETQQKQTNLIKSPLKAPENLTGILWKGPTTIFKNTVNNSPKRTVLITPTRLKYSVKTRSTSIQHSPIQNGRVTRPKIKIEHSRNNSASQSKNANMFPGSQLTFLIESFRR